ncbi:hypothetical protein KEM54_003535, partial [Ascosphaera aggregata]
MSSRSVVEEDTHQAPSSQASSRSSPLTIFPGADFTLPRPPPKRYERSAFSAFTGRINNMLSRGRRSKHRPGLSAGKRNLNPSVNDAPCGTAPLDSVPHEQDELSEDSGALQEDVNRVRGNALQTARQKVMASSPLIVEISTNKYLPPTDDPDWLHELRYQIAEIFNRCERDVHVLIDIPLFSLFGQTEEFYLAKVTAVDGALSLQRRRAQTTALLGLLADRLRVAHLNGIVRFINVNEGDLARDGRTLGEAVEYEAEFSQGYRQPNLQPERHHGRSGQACSAQPAVGGTIGDIVSSPPQIPPLRFHLPESGVEAQEAYGS